MERGIYIYLMFLSNISDMSDRVVFRIYNTSANVVNGL